MQRSNIYERLGNKSGWTMQQSFNNTGCNEQQYVNSDSSRITPLFDAFPQGNQGYQTTSFNNNAFTGTLRNVEDSNRSYNQSWQMNFNLGERASMTKSIPSVLELDFRKPNLMTQATNMDFESRPQQANQHFVQQPRKRYSNNETQDLNSFKMSKQDFSSSSEGKSVRVERSKFRCQVCCQQFTTPLEFEEHMASSVHLLKMNVLSAVYNDANKFLLNAVQSGENDFRPGVCSICDVSYGKVSEAFHLASGDHKHKQFLVRRGCRLCNQSGFSNYPAYVRHIDSVGHKKKKQDLERNGIGSKGVFANGSHLMKGKTPNTVKKPLSSTTPGLSKIQATKIVDTIKTEPEEVICQPSVINEDNYESKPDSDNPNLDSVTDISELKYNPDTAVGVDTVISVTGYFCKLCHKFYNNETMARVSHCKSQAHFDRYYESMQKKLQQPVKLSTTPTKTDSKLVVTKQPPSTGQQQSVVRPGKKLSAFRGRAAFRGRR